MEKCSQKSENRTSCKELAKAICVAIFRFKFWVATSRRFLIAIFSFFYSELI